MTAFAQVWAELARNLLDSEVLPLNVRESTNAVAEHVRKAKELYGERLLSQGIRFGAFVFPVIPMFPFEESSIHYIYFITIVMGTKFLLGLTPHLTIIIAMIHLT